MGMLSSKSEKRNSSHVDDEFQKRKGVAPMTQCADYALYYATCLINIKKKHTRHANPAFVTTVFPSSIKQTFCTKQNLNILLQRAVRF